MTPSRPPEHPLSRKLLQHEEFVRRLARRLVADAGAAEDVAQDALVLALQRGPRERTGLRAWLAGTVRNLARHRGRGEVRRRRREAAAARPEAVTLAEPLEEQQRVVEAVLALDEPFRETVLLTHYHGHAPAEIARRQGVPAATVRTRLHRAHEKLRRALCTAHGGDRRAWVSALGPFLAAEQIPAPPDAASVAGIPLPAAVLVGALVVVTSVGLWFLWDAENGADPAPSVRPAVAESFPAGATDAEPLRGSVAGAGTTRRLVADAAADDFAKRRAAFWDAVREARASMTRFSDSPSVTTRDSGLREKIRRVQVPALTVSAEEDLRLVVELLVLITNVQITVTPAAHAAIRERGLLVDIAFHESHSLATMLDLLEFLAHEDITWAVVDGEVRVCTPMELVECHVRFDHSVADLLIDPRDYFAPEDEIHPLFVRPLDTRDLAWLVMENVAVAGWEDPGVFISEGEAALTAQHRREVHEEIESFLDRLRSFHLPLPEEGSPGEPGILDLSAANRRVAGFLAATPLDILFAPEAREIPLSDLLARAAARGEFDFVVIEDVASAAPSVPVGPSTVAAALDALLARGVSWTLCQGIVVLWPKWAYGMRRATVLRDVRDLLTGATIPADLLTGHPALDRRVAEDDAPFLLTADELDMLIRDHVHPLSWDHDPSNLIRIANGVLTLSQSPGVVAEVDGLLATLRSLAQ